MTQAETAEQRDRTEAARRVSLVRRKQARLEKLAAELEEHGYVVHEASVRCTYPRPAGWHVRGCAGAYGRPCTCGLDEQKE